MIDWRDIKRGKTTDVYFLRTRKILGKLKKNPRVAMEISAERLPEGYSWAVFTGLEDVLRLLEGKPVDVYGLPEGSVFYPGEPVLTIEGRYREFGIYETAILGFLCQPSGIATKAARVKLAAGERVVLSFGARRMYPTIAPMIDRNAYIGGLDGVSVVKSAEVLGIEPKGTMPHALILIMGDTVKAAQAFDKYIEENVKRIVLVDTFSDEKFEALRVAEALGERLYAVRLDTPRSRRGDFRRIVEEVRWELDRHGFHHVKIFVSGGIDEYKIQELNDWVDAYGVGTAVSNAPVIDMSMDMVEVDGRPLAKKGKKSGKKKIFECECGMREVVPFEFETVICACGKKMKEKTEKLMENGKIIKPLPSIEELRERVKKEMKKCSL
mgnify:CR=1 FL=1